MTSEIVDRIVRSVLYEGSTLYPYRRSALKNQHRWNFGLVHPQGVEPSSMTTECLVEGNTPQLTIEIRFLQLVLEDSWQEPVERRVVIADCGVHPFNFDDIHGTVELTREPAQTGLEKIRVCVSNCTSRRE